ncbi:hypothetical protein FSHL1_006707 [Fusarium sambucinum]
MTTRLRNANPCDGCALRRVKCEQGKPCHECLIRGIECTALRTRKKRGPKGGLRTTTKDKVEKFQESIKNNQPSTAEATTPGQLPLPSYRIPLPEYERILNISKRPVSSIWIVINPEHLLTKISENSEDYESHALAAALCAATIAQLRLPEHAGPLNTHIFTPVRQRVLTTEGTL